MPPHGDLPRERPAPPITHRYGWLSALSAASPQVHGGNVNTSIALPRTEVGRGLHGLPVGHRTSGPATGMRFLRGHAGTQPVEANLDHPGRTLSLRHSGSGRCWHLTRLRAAPGRRRQHRLRPLLPPARGSGTAASLEGLPAAQAGSHPFHHVRAPPHFLASRIHPPMLDQYICPLPRRSLHPTQLRASLRPVLPERMAERQYPYQPGQMCPARRGRLRHPAHLAALRILRGHHTGRATRTRGSASAPRGRRTTGRQLPQVESWRSERFSRLAL